ncbi:hypothetical protein [Halobellus ordinarius]|uniref:hypothetical protein n=1 Tax=Halobellus ordinarius TaxID=3075120 RepID=UPI0028804511|nr:hypothetical protein [Halobellus sp. ZY16]
MGWTDPGVLEAHVRCLDSEGLADFVTDLWTARGFETNREGAYVIARRGGKKQVLYVLTRRATTRPVEIVRNVDIVVAAGRSGAGETLAAELGARFLDAADLIEMLRYALKRDVAADLCESHFGAAPEALRFPPRERVRRTVGGLETRTVAAVVIASLVVAVGAGAVFGLAGPGAGSGTTDEAAVTGGTLTNGGSDESATSTAEGGSTSTGAGGVDPSTVPGVSDTGISNASRLAQAHAAAVSDTASYTIWFDYYAPETGSTGRVQYDVDVRVQGERISVRASRERAAGNRSLLRTVYFDGKDRYVAENSSDEFSRIDDREPTATPRAVPFTRPAEMIRTYLATPESSVTAAGRDASGERYRLQGTGQPAALPVTVTDYEMTAIVDQRGFVWAFEAEFSILHDSDGDGVSGRERVRLTWTYDRVNSTEVRLTP